MRLSGKLILFIILIGLWSNVIFAQDPGADERIIGWSPDGTQLAITSNRTGQPELYIVDTQGNVLNHLFEGRAIWSANGSTDGQLWVILSSPDDETINELHQVNPITGESALLTTIPVSFDWNIFPSPDAQRITLVNYTTIMVINVSDGTSLTLGDDLYYPRVQWSPNSQYLAFVAKEFPDQVSEGVFFYDFVGGRRSRNLLATYWKREPACCLTIAEWSPDSTQLAIGVMLDANIYISTVMYQDLIPVAHTGGGIESLKWDSDGSGIYYYIGWRSDDFTRQELLEGGRGGGVYRTNLEGNLINPLITTQLGQVFSTVFSPDGDYFYALEMKFDGSRELLSFGNLTDGSLQALQLDFFKQMGVVWSPDSTRVAAALCETPESDADIYLINPVTGEAVNISQDDAFTGEAQPSNCPGMG